MNAQWVWRTILSLAAGAIVTLICLATVVDPANTGYVRYQQIITRESIQDLAQKIDFFKQEKGFLPPSLASISKDSSMLFYNGKFRDGWGNPIVYQRLKQKYRLTSWGRDGKHGGNGLDCDLSNDKLFPPQARLKPEEILADPLMKGMVSSSYFCGLCVCAITFCTLNFKAMERGLWFGVIWPFVVVLLMSAFISMFITAVHVPSGH